MHSQADYWKIQLRKVGAFFKEEDNELLGEMEVTIGPKAEDIDGFLREEFTYYKIEGLMYKLKLHL